MSTHLRIFFRNNKYKEFTLKELNNIFLGIENIEKKLEKLVQEGSIQKIQDNNITCYRGE